MPFPIIRMRRLRENPLVRRLVEETRLSREGLVMPYFVRHGKKGRSPISSMPGQFQFTVDSLLTELESLLKAGVSQILLFGIPRQRDSKASEAQDPAGIIPQAIRAIKERFPEILVIADVCLCEYTDHGHCGVVVRLGKDFCVVNDSTLPLLSQSALVYAEAGADIVAPSDMMDGRVRAIREALDKNGFQRIPILSYAAKFASAFYAPFREAAESAPQFGDRKSYQMNPANVREALREVALDVEEGADIVMVKPALAYLDVIRAVKEKFLLPVAAYHVSGEYAMVKAAAEKGWIDEKKVVLEMLTGTFRAGADVAVTYNAKEAAGWLRDGSPRRR